MAEMPGGKLINLPTAVVDVSPDYSSFTFYSCLEVAGQSVKEVVIATKEKEVGEETISKLVDTAIEYGVDIKPSDIKRVDICN